MHVTSCPAAPAGIARRLRLRSMRVGDLELQLIVGALRAGASAGVRLRARRDGRPVVLGRDVALTAVPAVTGRAVSVGQEAGRGPGEVLFRLAAASAGCHRLHLDFQVAGRTHTATFTEEVTA